MLTLEQARKRFYSDKPFEIEDTTSLDYARKQYRDSGGKINIEYDTDEVSSWFSDVNSALNNLSGNSKNGFLSYKDAIDAKKHSDSLAEYRAQSDYVRSYIDTLKGTKQYDELNKQFNNYTNSLNSYINFTKNASDFASKFDNEDDYNKAVTEATRQQKYGGLKTYADYLKAISGTTDSAEKEWLENKAYSVASSDDIKKRLDEYNKVNPDTSSIGLAYRNMSGINDENNAVESDAARKNLEKQYQQKAAEEKVADTEEKLKRNYYDLSYQEKQDVLDYLHVKDFEEPNNLAKSYIKKGEKIIKKHKTTPEDLAKWYPRGEQDEQALTEYEENKLRAKEDPWGSSFQSIIEKPFSDILTGANQIMSYFNSDDHYYNPKAQPNSRIQAIREGVSENLAEQDNDIWKALFSPSPTTYNIGMSTLDSGYNMLLGAFAGNVAGAVGATANAANNIQNVVTLAPAYTAASTDAFNRVIDSGGDYQNAMMTGVASGLAEVITEKVSLDQLKGFQAKGVNSFKQALGNIVKSTVVEGSEEAAADIVNTLTDNLINGGLSELELNKKRYREGGYSDKEAEWKAFQDWGYNLGMSALGGAAGGALFGAGTNTFVGGVGAVDNVLSGQDVKQSGNIGELVDIGSTYRPRSDTARAAAKVSKSLANSAEPSAYQVGKLRNSIMSDLTNPKEIQSRAQSFINEQNLTRDENIIAKKLIKGKQLNSTESEILSNSSGLKNVVAELDSVNETLSDNFARALMSTQGNNHRNFKTQLRDIQSLELGKDNMTPAEKSSALNKYADTYALSAREKAAFVNGYDGKTNIDAYATDFLAYNNKGRAAAPVDNIPKEYIAAYESGLNEYKTDYFARKALTKAQQRLRNKNNGYGEGIVDLSEIDRKKLTKDQRNNINYVSKFAKASGVNVKWFSSAPSTADGVITDPNGWYDPGTNTISLDTNADRKNINKALTQGAIHNTFSHELTHVAENAPEEYFALRDAIQKAVGAKAWEESVNNQRDKYISNHPREASQMTEADLIERASSEAIAEYCSNLLKDSSLLEQIVDENPSLVEKLKNIIKKVINNLKALHTRISKNYDVENTYANDLANKIKDMEALLAKWEAAVKQGIKNQNAKVASNKRQNKEAPATVQEQNNRNNPYNIKQSDIKTIQNIGKKSIFSFTSKEILETEPWAKEFWKTIGTKSPFFRAWFGDWRAYDKSKAKIADQKGNNRGVVRNDDTGWTINISAPIFNETNAHKSRKSKEAKPYLAYINDIVKKAVLLDTFNSNKTDSENSLFFHSFYCVADIGLGKELLKVTVEELNNPNSVADTLRAYKLTNIEKSSVGAEGSQINASPVTKTDDIITISDLQKAVKQHDVRFKPKEVNDIFLDENGEPKVFYHGTPNGTFNVFNDWQYFTDNESYADNYQAQGASSNGYKLTANNPKTYSVYLTADNVFDTRKPEHRDIFYNEFYRKWGNGAPLSDRGVPDWTDGDDLVEFFEEYGYDFDGVVLDEGAVGGYGEEVKSRGLSVAIKKSNQIKSATDNIGTFDRNNPDIRYQDRSSTRIDREYIDAVKRGDTKTAQRMVDEAAEKVFTNSKIRDDDGKLLKVYHGTDSDFTIFDRTKGRSGADIQGMFFSPWELDAQGYGSNVRAFYINIQNPAPESLGYKTLNKYAKENYRGIKAREELERLGYDGVNNGDEEYIVFNSAQIKSAAPITYDDNGDVIPLSQRFNDNNKDIRYQDRDSSSSTNDVISDTDSIFNFSDFTIDDDFDDDFADDLVEYRKIVKDDPVEAVRLIIGSSFRTISEAIKSGVEISDRRMKIIQNKVAQNFGIPFRNADSIGEALLSFINAEKNGSDIKNFETFINTLKTVLQYSEVDNVEHIKHIGQIKSILKDRILDVTSAQMPEIISQYDTWGNFVRTARAAGLRVRQARNVKAGSQQGVDINTLLIDLNTELGYDIYNGAEGITTSMDDADGIIQLVDYLEAQKELGTGDNPYINGKAENIDIAAVEMAFDTAREYIQRQGETATSKRNTLLVRTLNELKTKQEKLLKNYQSEKSNFKQAQKTLDDIKDIIDTINEDSEIIAQLDKQIYDAEHNEPEEIARLNDERKKAREKLSRDNRRLSSLKATKGMSTLIKNASDRATATEKEKWSKRLQEVRYEKNAQIKELKAQPRQNLNVVREEYREARSLTEVVAKIKKLGERMAKMLVNPNNKMYVPTPFQNTFLEVCKAFTDSIETDKDTQVSEKFNNLKNLLYTMNEGKVDEKQQIYYEEYENEFGKDVFTNIQEVSELLKKKLEGKIIDRKNLTLAEANDIYTLLRSIYDTVHDATIQLGERDGMTNRESGNRIIADNKKLLEEGYNKHEHVKNFKSLILNGIRTARMFTGYNEKAELMYHVRQLEKGNRERNKYIMDAEKIFHDVTDKDKEHRKAYEKSLTDVYEIEYEDYKGESHKLKLTRMLGLQILMSWDREIKSKRLAHMRKGGIKVANAELLAKGKIVEAHNKSTKIVMVTPSLISKIESSITDFEHEYRAAAEEYFNKYSKSNINRVTNILKHRSLATEDYYIPFQVDSNQLIKELEDLKFDYTIEGMGMLNSLQYKASQAIVINGLNTVVARHIEDTGKLCGLAIPVRNFKKAFNVITRGEVESAELGSVKIITDSAKESTNALWGKGGVEFFNHLISDLESTRAKPTDANEAINNVVKKVRTAFVVKTLTANISVIIKQAASYPTAGVYLSSASLAKGLAGVKDIIGKNHKYQALFDEIDEHTAQHYMRRQGMTQQELAEIASSWLGKAPTILNPTKWIQAVDVFTTAMLWKAAKADVDARYKKQGKALDNDEYWQTVTDLYDRVIEDTQPMYDSLHRTEIQKSTNEIIKTLIMFKTQPLQNTGILFDAAGDALRNKTPKARRTLLKAAASQVASLAVFAGMTFAAAITHGKLKRYKDKDDEVTPLSALSRIALDMLSNGAGLAAPLGGNEIVSAIINQAKDGYAFDVASDPIVDSVNDTYETIVNFVNMVPKVIEKAQYGALKVNDFQPVYDLAEQIAGIWKGIPVRNITNVIFGIAGYATGTTSFSSAGNRQPSEYAESYGRNFTSGNEAKAKTQLATLYQEKLDEFTAKNEDDPRKKAFSSVRSALANAYKLEYQKAVVNKNDARIQEITSLLSASGYMTYENKSLSETLSEWASSAKDAVLKSINK